MNSLPVVDAQRVSGFMVNCAGRHFHGRIDREDLEQEFLATYIASGSKEEAARSVYKMAKFYQLCAIREKGVSAKKLCVWADESRYFSTEESNEHGEYLDLEREIQEQEKAEQRVELESLILELPASQQEVLRLSIEGHRQGQIAMQLGISKNQADYDRKIAISRIIAIRSASVRRYQLFPDLTEKVVAKQRTYRRGKGWFKRKECDLF